MWLNWWQVHVVGRWHFKLQTWVLMKGMNIHKIRIKEKCYRTLMIHIRIPISVRYEVLTMALLHIPVFRKVLLCHRASAAWLLKGLYCLHLQGQAFFLDCLTTGTLQRIWRYQRRKLPSEVTLIIRKVNWCVTNTGACTTPPIVYHLYLNVHYTSHVKVMLSLYAWQPIVMYR